MSSHQWLCSRCAETNHIIVDKEMQQIRICSFCGVQNWCWLTSAPAPKVPKVTKKKKKSSTYHTKTLRLPKATFKDLKKEAKKVGCSVHSLILNYIHTGLFPPLIQTQSGYIPAPAPVRPPAIGLPPSRKKEEKSDLVKEIEKHPMFKKMKERYM